MITIIYPGKTKSTDKGSRRAIICELLQMANTGNGYRQDFGERNPPEQLMQQTISVVGKYNQERYA